MRINPGDRSVAFRRIPSPRDAAGPPGLSQHRGSPLLRARYVRSEMGGIRSRCCNRECCHLRSIGFLPARRGPGAG